MLRRVLLPLVLFLVLLLAVVFAALNPGAIDVDLGLFETRMQKSLALTLAFAVGWLFGLVCLATVMLRMVMEPRPRAGEPGEERQDEQRKTVDVHGSRLIAARSR